MRRKWNSSIRPWEKKKEGSKSTGLEEKENRLNRDILSCRKRRRETSHLFFVLFGFFRHLRLEVRHFRLQFVHGL